MPPMATQTAQTGYYLVNEPGKGFGILWAKGSPSGTSDAYYLGNTLTDVKNNLAEGGGHTGAIGIYEVDWDQMLHDLGTRHIAWYTSVPGNAQPTDDLYTLAAGIAGAPEVAAIFNAAGLTDVFDADTGNAATTIPGEDGAGGDLTAKDVEEATDPNAKGDDTTDDNTDDPNNDKVKFGPSGVSALSGLLSWLEDPHTWIRLAELIGGAALVLMGLRSLTGSTTTPVSVIQSGAKTAATVAAA